MPRPTRQTSLTARHCPRPGPSDSNTSDSVNVSKSIRFAVKMITEYIHLCPKYHYFRCPKHLRPPFVNHSIFDQETTFGKHFKLTAVLCVVYILNNSTRIVNAHSIERYHQILIQSLEVSCTVSMMKPLSILTL